MGEEGYVQCRRCKGKGLVEEYGWDYDEITGEKSWGRQRFRCVVCQGTGEEYNLEAYKAGITPKYSTEWANAIDKSNPNPKRKRKLTPYQKGWRDHVRYLKMREKEKRDRERERQRQRERYNRGN